MNINDCYVVNKKEIEDKITKCDKILKNKNELLPEEFWQISIKKEILEELNQSLKPITPILSDAFDKGSESGSKNWDSYLKPNIEQDKQIYLSKSIDL